MTQNIKWRDALDKIATLGNTDHQGFPIHNLADAIEIAKAALRPDPSPRNLLLRISRADPPRYHVTDEDKGRSLCGHRGVAHWHVSRKEISRADIDCVNCRHAWENLQRANK